jgi:hypothetical protein
LGFFLGGKPLNPLGPLRGVWGLKLLLLNWPFLGVNLQSSRISLIRGVWGQYVFVFAYFSGELRMLNGLLWMTSNMC